MKKKTMVQPRQFISIITAIMMLLSITFTSLGQITVQAETAPQVPKVEITIENPYETVDWTANGQYKADFHAHSVESDGSDQPAAMIEKHYALGFDVLAMTDHNFLSTTWDRTDRAAAGKTWLTTSRLTEIASGSDRDGKGMTAIPYSDEQSISDHVNTFWATFNNTAGATYESSVAKAQELGGLSHLNHPGRYTGGSNTANNGLTGAAASNNPAQVSKYVNLFDKYNSCVGMEIINKKDGDSYSDRILWDNILTRMMPERPVWGFSNDDTHALASTGFSYNMLLMPTNTEANVRMAMEKGTFYAVAKVAKRELGNAFVSSGNTPKISNIVIDEKENTISISGTDYNSIEWIADGQVIATGTTIDINSYEDKISTYIRAQLIGNGGISFTQPFGVNGLEKSVVLGAVLLEATTDTLIPGGTETTDLSLKATGSDSNEMDLAQAQIVWNTDKTGVINISADGLVTFAKVPTANEEVKIWATVTLDGKTVSSNDIRIKIVVPSPDDGSIKLQFPIKASIDDVEEYVANHVMYTTSTDLELMWETPTGADKQAQIIGLRFADATIPKNAVIQSAYIQFSVDEADKNEDPFHVEIKAEQTANAPMFTTVNGNVSGRTWSTNAVVWENIPSWTTEHETSVNQRTPELKEMVQEIVNRADWVSGNALGFALSGTGCRTAESFEGAGAVETDRPTLVVKVQKPASVLDVSTSITGPERVSAGQTFSLKVSLKDAVGITAQNLKLTYDSSVFSLTACNIPNHLMLLGKKETMDAVEVVLASEGSEYAINGEADVLELVFKVNVSKPTSDFTMMKAALSDKTGHVFEAKLATHTVKMVDTKALTLAIAEAEFVLAGADEGTAIGQYPTGTKEMLSGDVTKAKTSRDNTASDQNDIDNATSDLNAAIAKFKARKITAATGDFNNTGVADIGDLGILAGYYGMKAGDAGWDLVEKYDLNGDNAIGIYEMAFIVLQLLK